MITIPLYEGTAPIGQLSSEGDGSPDEQPRLDCFPHPDGGERPVILVCPGGGYHRRADHEGEPIGQWANALGCHGAVLHYRVVPHMAPTAQNDGARALELIRDGALPMAVDWSRTVVLGFSAGGHLAGCLATLPDQSLRPAAAVLCYAVATVEFMHAGSFRALVGPDGDPTPWGIDTRIDAATPPLFLWHTAEDKAVDVRNAYEVASACAAHEIPHEVHVFPKGRHGIGMLTLPNHQDPALLASAGQWPDLCARWLAGIGIGIRKDEA